MSDTREASGGRQGRPSLGERVNVHFRIPVELKDRLDRIADERMVSSSMIATAAIKAYLDGLEAIDL